MAQAVNNVKNEKPWYKKFKILVAIIGVFIEGTTLFVGSSLMPEKMDQITALMISVGAIVIAVIGGHSVTDAANALKKK